MHIALDIAIDPFYTVNPLLEKAPMIAAAVVGVAALAAVVILRRRSMKK